MNKEESLNYQEFQKTWMTGATIVAIPMFLIAILGFVAISNASDKAAQEFSVKSEFHKIAVSHYRNCNKPVLDSKEQCLAASIQITEQMGAENSKQIASDLIAFADKPKPSAFDILEAGILYFWSEE